MKRDFSLGRKEYDEETNVAKSDDQYFTHPQISKMCWSAVESLFDLDSYDTILEPSAGDGSFLNLMPEDKRVGVDLVKQHPEVVESDFFKWYPDSYQPLLLETNKKIITVGNPPFGRNSNLAIQFFNHAALFSDVICFIIPRTWRKWSVQSKLNSDFGLYFDATLPYQSFYVAGKPWTRIRCCFQIWSRINPGKEIDQLPDWKDTKLDWELVSEKS